MHIPTTMQASVRRAALGLALAVSFAPLARADQAIVVGVNQYPKLEAGSNLEGCLNDADSIAAALKGVGFNVTELTDGQATKEGILDAVKNAKCGGDERFVFFFAGHGTKSSEGKSAILPTDAQQGSEANDISADDLYQAVQGVTAKSRTVLLDSCFSGAMSRALLDRHGRHPHQKSRFYR